MLITETVSSYVKLQAFCLNTDLMKGFPKEIQQTSTSITLLFDMRSEINNEKSDFAWCDFSKALSFSDLGLLVNTVPQILDAFCDHQRQQNS